MAPNDDSNANELIDECIELINLPGSLNNEQNQPEW